MKKLNHILAMAILAIFFLVSLVGAASLFNYPKFKGATSTGAPLSGGKLYTYAPGTSTPKATYADKAKAVANANPVVLDSNGEATIYLDGYYKMILKNSTGVTQWTMDNVQGIGSSVVDYVTISDYSGDLAAAVTAIGSTPTTLIINSATTCTTNVTVPSTLHIRAEKAGVITISSGKTLTINGPYEAAGWPFTGSGSVSFSAQAVSASTLISPIAARAIGTSEHGGADTSFYGQGLNFVSLNSAAALKSYGSVIGRIVTSTAGSESGDIWFCPNSADTFYTPVHITHNGALIVDPGASNFVSDMSKNLAGAYLTGARISGAERDNDDARPIEVRNLKVTDLTSTDYSAGYGFVIYNTGGEETIVGYMKGAFTVRTAGAERTKLYFITRGKDQAQITGPIIGPSSNAKGDYTGDSPELYSYRKRIQNKTTSYSVAKNDASTVIANSGAKADITITLPNLDAIGVGFPIEIRTGMTIISKTSGYEWIASGADAGAYYLRKTGGGDPGFASPTAIYYAGLRYTAGVGGALANEQWAYGDYDTLGFNTIYIQPSGGNPDTLAASFGATYKITVTPYSTTYDPIFYTGVTNNSHVLSSDGLMGTALIINSFFVGDTWVKGWEGTATGTWTRIS